MGAPRARGVGGFGARRSRPRREQRPAPSVIPDLIRDPPSLEENRMRQFNQKDGPLPRRQDGPYPQPLAGAGEQRRESDVTDDELRAAREWLRHVEAGRIG